VLHYTESLAEPVQEEVSFYDAAFQRVYGRICPSLRGVHHEIQALQSQRVSPLPPSGRRLSALGKSS
jgi:hypothetical protein